MNKAAVAVRKVLKVAGMNQTQLAEKLHEDRRNLNQQLTRQNDMKVERFMQLLGAMGYHLEIVSDTNVKDVEYDEDDERWYMDMRWIQ